MSNETAQLLAAFDSLPAMDKQEFAVEVLRRTREAAGIAHTEALLEGAANSGKYIKLTEQEWDRLQGEALAEVETRAKRLG